MHEASMHENNSFITLTYNDEHLPNRSNLQHKDFQDFIKKVRKKHNVRYYMAGEYGTENKRPHFHACLFGHDWEDKLYHQTTASGEKIYTSKELDKLWGKGYASTGNVTYQSAAYIARYCVQKITGDLAEEHYKRYDHLGEYQLNSEYNRMSLKPGIGKEWIKKFESDVYTYDNVIVNGQITGPIKYYDKMYKKENEVKLEEIKEKRMQEARERYQDNTERRLNDKEKVAIAKSLTLLRGKV